MDRANIIDVSSYCIFLSFSLTDIAGELEGAASPSHILLVSRAEYLRIKFEEHENTVN
ncbi:MAG: hypothetical protein ACEY3D_03720 [Rickettsia sp.]|uniref:hypothetical protein n=1 Tax=Rickettsia sp. TaxID=789 RepID=UPI003978D048